MKKARRSFMSAGLFYMKCGQHVGGGLLPIAVYQSPDV
ncbi:hypothetical protein C4J88_1493 [Pseudomonas sp. R4-39-08]|nr:hypothetical protein C4J88_1493 [Pseudomonas sp. R4-39-08]